MQEKSFGFANVDVILQLQTAHCWLSALFIYHLRCIVLYCIVLYCIVLYCIVLYCIVLYCIVFFCIKVSFRFLSSDMTFPSATYRIGTRTRHLFSRKDPIFVEIFYEAIDWIIWTTFPICVCWFMLLRHLWIIDVLDMVFSLDKLHDAAILESSPFLLSVTFI